MAENAENIYRLLRLASNKSIRELANDMDVSPSYISEIENGKRTPSNALREKYSHALGIKQSTIMYFEEESNEHDRSFQEMLLLILNKLCGKDRSDT